MVVICSVYRHNSQLKPVFRCKLHLDLELLRQRSKLRDRRVCRLCRSLLQVGLHLLSALHTGANINEPVMVNDGWKT